MKQDGPVDHNTCLELFRRECAEPPLVAFPLMKVATKNTQTERAREALRAIPFALPKKREG